MFPPLPLLLLLLLPLTVPGSGGVDIVGFKVPDRVQAGETVQLACRYDLEGASLYSLNWWRGSEQFYQFSLNTPRHITVYDTQGINVDVSRSDGEVVVLRNVSHTTAGRYKCEVLADYPSFEKDAKYARMEVVDVPETPPRIFLRSLQWSPGEVLEANCSSPGTRPPPQLHWYINGDEIPTHSIREVSLDSPRYLPLGTGGVGGGGRTGNTILGEVKELETESSRVSKLKMWLNSTYFNHERQATLTCAATLPGLYRRSADVYLSLPGYRDAASSQKLYGATHQVSSEIAVVLGLVVFAMFPW